MRTLLPSVVEALSRPTIALVQLVRMDLTQQMCLNTSGWNLEWDGKTWLGTGGLGSIGSVEDAPGEVKGLQFSLSGVHSDSLALALLEPVQGRAAYLYTAVCNADTGQILDATLEWAGRLDAMAIEEDPNGQASTITVTAEHAGIDLLRPSMSRYTDTEQRRLYPGDRGFEYLIDQAEQTIVWPAASFFRR